MIDNDRAVIAVSGGGHRQLVRSRKDDPDLALLRFDTEQADIWEANLGSTLKAVLIKLTGRDPGKDHQKEHRAEVQLT